MILILSYELVGIPEEIFLQNAVILSLQGFHSIKVPDYLEWTVFRHPDFLFLFLELFIGVHVVFLICTVI